MARQVLAMSGGDRGSFASILFTRTQGFAFAQPGGRLVTEQITLGDSAIRLSRVTSTGHWIRLTEDRDASFLFPRAGSLALRIAATDSRVAAGDAVLVRPAARDTRVIAPGDAPFEGHVMMLPWARLDALAEATGSRALLGRDVVRLAGPQAGRLMRYVAAVLAEAEAGAHPPSPRALAGMGALVQDILHDWLAGAARYAGPRGVAPARPDDPAMRPGATAVTGSVVSATERLRARRAADLLQARFDEPLSVADLARDMGISLRSLQLAFQAVYGEGPRARLTRIRLDKVRERLLLAEPHDQVTAIALDCGFTHLGRFAEVYQRTFGERPSETLEQCRQARRVQRA